MARIDDMMGDFVGYGVMQVMVEIRGEHPGIETVPKARPAPAKLPGGFSRQIKSNRQVFERQAVYAARLFR